MSRKLMHVQHTRSIMGGEGVGVAGDRAGGDRRDGGGVGAQETHRAQVEETRRNHQRRRRAGECPRLRLGGELLGTATAAATVVHRRSTKQESHNDRSNCL